MNTIEVGKRFPLFKHIEGVFTDISDSGITIFFSWPDPDPSEIKSFTLGNFKIRSGIIDNLLFLAFKPGAMHWQDSYWVPKINVHLPEADDREGLALTLVLIDGRTGIVEKIRMIRLGTEFSKSLKDQIDFIVKYKRGDLQEGVMRARNVQDLYSTDELVPKLKNEYETTIGDTK